MMNNPENKALCVETYNEMGNEIKYFSEACFSTLIKVR